jgi:hypothetical protein
MMIEKFQKFHEGWILHGLPMKMMMEETMNWIEDCVKMMMVRIELEIP